MIREITLFVSLAMANIALAQTPTTMPTTQNTALRAESPTLKRFNEAIRFYASFDEGIVADLATDKADPVNTVGKVELHPGLYGKSMLLLYDGCSYIAYKTEDVDLTKPGSLAVWLSPYQWVRSDHEDYFWPVKLMGNNAQLMFGRMGQQLNPKTRDDALYLWSQVGQSQGVSIGYGTSLAWKNGEWHLWVMNWRANWIEFSMDGGPLAKLSLPGRIDPSGPKGALFIVGQQVPSDRCLFDDLIVFNRPLADDEVKWMYDEGMKQARLLPAPTTAPTSQPNQK